MKGVRERKDFRMTLLMGLFMAAIFAGMFVLGLGSVVTAQDRTDSGGKAVPKPKDKGSTPDETIDSFFDIYVEMQTDLVPPGDDSTFTPENQIKQDPPAGGKLVPKQEENSTKQDSPYTGREPIGYGRGHTTGEPYQEAPSFEPPKFPEAPKLEDLPPITLPEDDEWWLEEFYNLPNTGELDIPSPPWESGDDRTPPDIGGQLPPKYGGIKIHRLPGSKK